MKITNFFGLVLPALFFWAIQLYPSQGLGESIAVVTSIFPVADMVRVVGEEHVDVTFIMPAGASPHTFEPKPSLVKKITRARIFFMIGAGLEFWAEKFVKLAGPGLKTVVLSEGVALIHTTGDHYEAEHPYGKPHISDRESSVANPHIWLDPVIAKAMVAKIVVVLSKVDRQHEKFYRQQGRKYLSELDKLDKMIKAEVDVFKIKEFVSFHASWDYFARRYGLEPVGVIEAAPGRNPTPIRIKNIVDRIKQHSIQAVFAEPQLNPRAAEVIAQEAKVKVLLLDPLGGPRMKRRSNYIDLMKYNLNVLREAMQ
ncbi:MAG: metal ABC transporter substrate-binding protein [Candidatus Desulfatibia sp.]|uniref:metal ABC transporter substrate-binding protein n=1 Tax=Candidatus Desulfatibia sp. TaxID=3101189 RepID=UPI002F3272FB